MATTWGVGMFELLFLFGFGGGLPLGVPPLPEDPALVAMAPEECLFYFSSAGMGEPNANSKNQVEQMLAEPEVGNFLSGLGQNIKNVVQANLGNSPEQATLAEHGPQVVNALLTRPFALFVSKLNAEPMPTLEGGLLINTGDQTEALKRSTAALERLLPGGELGHAPANENQWGRLSQNGVQFEWGFHDNYFILGAGPGSADAIVAQMKGQPPKWLTAIRQKLPVERFSSMNYLNVSGVAESIQKVLGNETPMGKQFLTVLKALEIDKVKFVTTVGGLDGLGVVTKTWLALDGKPQRIFGLADAQPLTKQDLAPIPKDATIAAVARLNAEQFFQRVVAALGQIDPTTRDQLLNELKQMEQVWGVRLSEDVLQSLGDVWCFYVSPAESGSFLTGLTAVVGVRDRAKLIKTHDKLLYSLKVSDEQRRSDAGPIQIRGFDMIKTFDFQGQTVYFFNVVGVFSLAAPAWCFTENQLVVGLYPQTVKAYLSREKEAPSLAEVPEVAKMFDQSPGPLAINYQDTRSIFRQFYPFLQIAFTGLSSQAQLFGVSIDPSLLPSARSIERHLSASASAVFRDEEGIISVSRRSLPGAAAGPGIAAPVALSFALPAIQKAREAGRRTQSKNNLKRIALALHTYHDAKKAFPAAYTADKDGKPLLSWRVALLPYTEAGELYKEFHLDEPWDSEHNKKLIARMPAVYVSPLSKVSEQGKTNYLTIRGPNTIFPGGKPVAIKQVSDGLSKTVLTVEANDDRAVIWTKPDDYELDTNRPMDGLLGFYPDGFHVGLADGSVWFWNDFDPQNLNALFTRSGNEAVNIPPR